MTQRQAKDQSLNYFYRMWFVLGYLLIARLCAMVGVPLNDSTEARYAEIARLMLDTGNWITPMHHPGAFFWAKPPLSTWLSAASMGLFGVSAWAARLPALILSIVILAYVWQFAKKYRDRQYAITVVLLLAGSFYFFLDAGTVMTDPALLTSTTLSILFFWQAVMQGSRLASYGFFVGLGVGLLAKGPIAVVLIGLPLFAWTLYFRQWRALWQRLPWIKGSVLMLVIALPWYIAAEMRTPGFLNYFIVGEHLQRFLTPGWQGDKYGFAHHAPIGMIWVYALLGFMPWSLVCLGIWKRSLHVSPSYEEKNWLGFVWFCALMPLVFFTLARNIIYPYVFPALPFMALLLTEYLHRKQIIAPLRQWLLWGATVVGSGFLLVTALFIYKPEWVSKSQDRVIASVTAPLIYWNGSLDYSAEFYSQGKARATLDEQQLLTWLNQDTLPHYIVVAPNLQRLPLPASLSKHMVPVAQIPYHYALYTVYRWE